MKLITFICLLISCAAMSQPTKPIEILHPSSMPYRSGNCNSFGFNNDFFIFNNNASVSDSVMFPATDVYSFIVSAWSNFSKKQWSNLQIRIDGNAIANLSISNNIIDNYTAISNVQILSGTHLVSMALTNHSSTVNVLLKVGLCYVMQGSNTGSLTLPQVQKTAPDSSMFITVNNWMSGKMRGFNEGTEGTYHPTTESNYAYLKNLGANLVRHHFSIILNTATDEYYFEQGDLQRFDSMIAWAEKYNFYVNIGFDQDPHDQNQLWWGNKHREQSITNLWKIVADRYKDRKHVCAYSPLNEPTPAGRVGEYLNWIMEIIDTIRSVDTNHCIVFPFAHDVNILKMMLPLPYANVLYEYHFYDPFAITAQGINGFTQKNLYPSTGGNIGVYTKDNLSLKLDPWRLFHLKYNAPIYIGEFGCVRWAPKNASGESSSDRWYTDCISLFEAEGYPWTLTSFRESEIWDTEISSWYFYKCPYRYAEPTCNFGQFDIYRKDTTAVMKSIKAAFLLNSK